jgi:hypothetical protein
MSVEPVISNICSIVRRRRRPCRIGRPVLSSQHRPANPQHRPRTRRAALSEATRRVLHRPRSRDLGRGPAPSVSSFRHRGRATPQYRVPPRITDGPRPPKRPPPNPRCQAVITPLPAPMQSWIAISVGAQRNPETGKKSRAAQHNDSVNDLLSPPDVW